MFGGGEIAVNKPGEGLKREQSVWGDKRPLASGYRENGDAHPR